MKKTITAFLAAAVCLGASAQGDPVSATNYDWSGLSSGICQGKTTAYDKFYAIYRWLCDNIAYDTSYSIYTADQCYENKRGVCQAYSELFYRLAEAEGLKVDVVSGKSKSDEGVSDEGHAWVLAYTDPTTAMLIDPTWGAGSVNDGVFTRNKKDDSWFNVHPTWMIFTHYPTNSMYQLLPSPLSFEQFAAIPAAKPYLRKFGMSGSQMLEDALQGLTPQMPECYDLDEVEAVGMPQQPQLEVGQYYTMQVKTHLPLDRLGFMGNATNGNKGEWQQQGDVAVGRVLVARPGHLSLSIKTDPSETAYTTIAKFKVPTPSSEQLSRLEAADPMQSPYWDDVKNAEYSSFRQLPIDFGPVLATIKQHGIKTIPIFYSGTRYSVGAIPWNGKLKAGQQYTFEFMPQEGVNCAVINEGDWYSDWAQPTPGGPWVISVTPQKPGMLKVSIQQQEGGSYTTCFSYEVE